MSYFGFSKEQVMSIIKKYDNGKGQESPKKLWQGLRSSGQAYLGWNHEQPCSACNKKVTGNRVTRYRYCTTKSEQVYLCNKCKSRKDWKAANCVCGNPGASVGKLKFCTKNAHVHVQPPIYDELMKEFGLNKRTRKPTKEQQAKPYMDSGLAEPFAMAIVEGTDANEVMSLWESDWWKQYPPSDILVLSVLNGIHTESDGKYLNTIRSDHERLALACVIKKVNLEWAKALLTSGFDAHPDAVNSALDGGIPSLIARIRGIKFDDSTIPTELGFIAPTIEKILGD